MTLLSLLIKTLTTVVKLLENRFRTDHNALRALPHDTKLMTHSAVGSKIQNRSQLIHRIDPHPVFTARCYAERGYDEIACRLSSFYWEI